MSPDFTKGTFKDVDLTGADLAGPRGVAGLRGATVSALQLIDLGPALAAVPLAGLGLCFVFC